jgi:hypothetical protein
MNKKIIDPVWGNNEKTHIMCIFEYEDGSSSNASIMNTEENVPNNPDWDQVFENHSVEDIDKNSKNNIGMSNRKVSMEPEPSQEEKEEHRKNRNQKDLNERLFQAKLEAFEIDEIKESKNRILKSKIRKSKSLLAVQAYAAAIILGELSEPVKKPAKKKATKKK